MDNKKLTAKDVAKILGVSTNTVNTWRKKDRGPKYVRQGYKTFIYDLKDVLEFAKEMNYDTTE